ncbi:MAG TPA: lanthionine synthetase LanC family protein [Pyrinomonadaceae bacterium]|nr:lanthionine synthetase LanC family protein [Pyrinomonadaceae bacterium]
MTQDPSNFLSTAATIGDALCREALWWGDRCTWLGDDLIGEEEAYLVHRTVGGSLYTGTAGIALFLARLAFVNGERLHADTARGAITQALREVETAEELRLKGLFGGRAGVACASVVVGECLDDTGLAEAGHGLLRALAREETNGWTETDVMYGRAGAIVAALSVSRRFSDDALLAWARELGEQLLRDAKREETGWSWPEKPDEPGMNGFSHGVAGVAWALGELARSCGEEQFFHAAREATRYEQRWFDADVSNWRDLFPEYMADASRPPEYSLSWCHGAPGIALSRLRLWELFRDPAHREEARLALSTTAEALRTEVESETRNFSLCHGLAGNAEALIIASHTFGDEGMMRAAREIGLKGIENYAESEESWPCGVNNADAWSPSLMLGWAGTGYFYLRLHDPRVTPSVLLLDC